MTTKISAEQESLPLSKNLAPKGISSGTVSYAAGVVAGDNVVTEIAAGSVVVPGYPYVVYVNTVTGLVTAGLESAVPITNSVLLYRGDSQNHLEDLRSWTQHDGDITSTVPAFVSTLRSFSPTHLYDMSEQSGTVVNDTGGGTQVDATITNNGGIYLEGFKVWTIQEDGILLSSGSGGGDIELDSVPTMFQSGTKPSVGSVVGMFKLHRPSSTQPRPCFSFGTAGTGFFKVSVNSSNFLFVEIIGGTGGNAYSLTHNVSLADHMPHWFAVVQDGVAIKVYLDGVDITGSMTPTVVGSGDATFWIADVVDTFTATAMWIGGQNTIESNMVIGPLALYDSHVLGPVDITALQDTLYDTFDVVINSLSPDTWLKFDEHDSSGGFLTNFNAGASGTSFQPTWTTAPALLVEAGFPSERGRRGASRLTGANNYINSATTGLSNGITSGGYGTIVIPFLYGTAAASGLTAPIFDLHNTIDSLTLVTSIQAGPATNPQEAYLEWVTQDGASSAATHRHTDSYGDDPINDGEWHLIYIVKNNDTNAPDIYLDNVLLTASSTVTGASGDPDRWIDDFTDFFKLGANRAVVNGFFRGMCFTDFVYYDSFVPSAGQRTAIYDAWANEKTTSVQQALQQLGAPNLWMMDGTNGVVTTDRGYLSRISGATGLAAAVTVNKGDGTTTKVAGVVSDFDAMSSAQNDGIYADNAILLQLDNNTEGAVMMVFKGTMSSTFDRLYSYGDSGAGATHEMMLVTGGIFQCRIRNTGSNEYRVQVNTGNLADDNWHIVCWRGNGTNWTVYIDGIWYNNASPEWSVITNVGISDETYWQDLVTGGNQLGVGTGANLSGGFAGELGPGAMWMGEDLPSNAQIHQFATLIGLA